MDITASKLKSFDERDYSNKKKDITKDDTNRKMDRDNDKQKDRDREHDTKHDKGMDKEQTPTTSSTEFITAGSSPSPNGYGSLHIPFWAENPNIIFQKEYLLEFFPIESMTYEQKLNAITRTILILTFVGFLITHNIRLIFVTAITLFAIFILHHYHQKEKDKKTTKKQDLENLENFENFENKNPVSDYLEQNGVSLSKNAFMKPDSDNPFSNVLISDYDYNPNKKPAPPAFNANVNSQILEQAKQLVSNANPDQPDIADKLFKDLGEQFVFEQSLRPFNSTANTTIPNDQGAFADFCYGSMVSCKEGNPFACARNLSRYTN